MSNKRSNPSSIALHPNEPEVDEADCLPQLTLRNLGCGKCCPQADQNKDKKAVDQGRGHDCWGNAGRDSRRSTVDQDLYHHGTNKIGSFTSSYCANEWKNISFDRVAECYGQVVAIGRFGQAVIRVIHGQAVHFHGVEITQITNTLMVVEVENHVPCFKINIFCSDLWDFKVYIIHVGSTCM